VGDDFSILFHVLEKVRSVNPSLELVLAKDCISLVLEDHTLEFLQFNRLLRQILAGSGSSCTSSPHLDVLQLTDVPVIGYSRTNFPDMSGRHKHNYQEGIRDGGKLTTPTKMSLRC
jgi:hypothetical protein